MSLSVADRIDTTRAARGLVPLCVGAGVAQLLDRMSGWRRFYADDIAVVHVRAGHAARRDVTGELK